MFLVRHEESQDIKQKILTAPCIAKEWFALLACLLSVLLAVNLF